MIRALRLTSGLAVGGGTLPLRVTLNGADYDEDGDEDGDEGAAAAFSYFALAGSLAPLEAPPPVAS